MKHFLLSILIAVAPFALHAQANRGRAKPEAPKTDHFSGLKFRSIGPAFMSGRIADIAIHPQKASTWYVAVGSGGVWKTRDAGQTLQCTATGMRAGYMPPYFAGEPNF